MKANFFMAIAILISATVAAQTNTTVKTGQSVNADTKADVKKAGESTQSNANVSANTATTAEVKTDAVHQTKTRAKKEGKAALTTAAEKKNDLKTETGSAAGTVKQEASVHGGSNASVNTQKGTAAEVTAAGHVKTDAVQSTETNIRKKGKVVLNSTVEAKKEVGAETKNTIKAVKKQTATRSEANASVKAEKAVKVDASSNQGAKVKPGSIGVKTRVAGASGVKLR
jgi:hypothetical protein